MVYFMSKHVILAVILLFLVGCTGLGGEPEIASTIPAQQVALAQPRSSTPDIGFPQSPPDLANGAAIYAQNCTACHGVNGEGDGELVLSGQVANPGNFRDPTSARQQTPDDWFETITVGKIENLMPPWQNALTEQERWDVAMYTYTMHYTHDQLELGEILYADCAECHGLEGRGDGPEAGNVEGEVKSLVDQNAMITLSDNVIYNMVVEGQGSQMPAYGDRLNEEELRAVVSYTRTLSLQNIDMVIGQEVAQAVPTSTLDGSGVATALPPSSSAIPSIPTSTLDGSGAATALPSIRTGDITGSVANGTSGATVPSDLTVTLRVFNQSDGTPLDDLTRETTLNADGTYVFEDVSIENGRAYLTAVEYSGRNFASGIFLGTQNRFDLPIIIYELTDDPNAVIIDAAVTQTQVSGETIETVYSVRFVNNSDRLFTSTEAEGDGRFKSISVNLPPGSVVVGLPDRPRYIISEDGMTVWDTQPLQPGEERFLQVTYILPYTDGAVIEYPMPFPVEGQVRVLVQPDTITLNSDQLTSAGEETLGDETYQGYGNPLSLPAGSLITYTLNGQPANAAIVQDPGVVSSESLPLILIGFGLGVAALVGAFYVLSRRGNRTADKGQLIDGLVRQIAELDAQHEAGNINHDLYRNRREQLKTRLAALMDNDE
jgi:mono/diheme cytochrome c family protein